MMKMYLYPNGQRKNMVYMLNNENGYGDQILNYKKMYSVSFALRI